MELVSALQKMHNGQTVMSVVCAIPAFYLCATRRNKVKSPRNRSRSSFKET